MINVYSKSYSTQKSGGKSFFGIIFSIILIFYSCHLLISTLYSQIGEGIAAVETWDSHTTAPQKSEKGVYQIYTAEEFAYIFYTGESVNAELCNSINMNRYYWKGTELLNSFSLDGKNNTIYGLKFTDYNSSYCGLIPYSTGQSIYFSNIHLIVQSSDIYCLNFGAFIGAKTGGGLFFTNCTVSGEIKLPTDGNCNGGGFVGCCSNYTTFKKCFNFANINKYFHSKVTYMGGLVGRVDNNPNSYIDFDYCGNHGDVIAKTANTSYENFSAGGIVGYGYNVNFNNSKCYNSGNIKAQYGFVGGIVGRFDCGSTYTSSSVCKISYVYNTGSVTSEYKTAGGLIGYSVVKVSISNAYNAGYVSSSKTKIIPLKKVNSVPYKLKLWRYNYSTGKGYQDSSTTDVYMYVQCDDLVNYEIIGNADKWNNVSSAATNKVYYQRQGSAKLKLTLLYKTASDDLLFVKYAYLDSAYISKDIYLDEMYEEPRWPKGNDDEHVINMYPYNKTLTFDGSKMSELYNYARSYEKSVWGFELTGNYTYDPFIIGFNLSWSGDAIYSKGELTIAPLVCYNRVDLIGPGDNSYGGKYTSLDTKNNKINGKDIPYTARCGWNNIGYNAWINYIIPCRVYGYTSTISIDNNANYYATILQYKGEIMSTFGDDPVFTSCDMNDGYPIFSELYW